MAAESTSRTTSQEPFIRPLTKDEKEIFSETTVKALVWVAAFRDGVALMRPFYDATCESAYTDSYARVGLGPDFFSWSLDKRVTVLLHEVLHILNRHFTRAETFGGMSKLINIAGDFEINCALSMQPRTDISDMIMPNKAPFTYPVNLSMEKYARLLLDDENFKPKGHGCTCPKSDEEAPQGDTADPSGGGEGSSSGDEPQKGEESQGAGSSSPGDTGEGQDQGASPQESSQTPGGEGSSAGDGQDGNPQSDSCPTCGGGTPEGTCDTPTEDRKEGADQAGIPRASETEQNIARRNTAARVAEEKRTLKNKGGIGNGQSLEFLNLVEGFLAPPQVPWQQIFRKKYSLVSDSITTGGADYSMRRLNRRRSDSSFIFPALVQYKPTAMLAVDISGSMGGEDFQAAMAEVEGIMKAAGRTRDGFRAFAVDTRVSKVKTVSSVKDMKFTGGGGTDMAVGLAYVNTLKPRERPDIFVLATDGFTDWTRYEQELLKNTKGGFVHVLLVTNADGFAGVPPSVRKLCTVIDISKRP